MNCEAKHAGVCVTVKFNLYDVTTPQIGIFAFQKTAELVDRCVFKLLESYCSIFLYFSILERGLQCLPILRVRWCWLVGLCINLF